MSNQIHIVKVDASDTSRFTYYNVQQYGPYHGQGWSMLTGASVDPDKEGPIYNNTLQVAPLEDISVEFPFNGTRISVFGTIRPPTASYAPLPVTKYSLIGWDWGGIPAMNPYQAPNVTEPQNNVNFWSSQEMPYKEYILTINVTTATVNMPFYLDYVTIEVPGPDPNATSSTAASTSTTGTTSSSRTSSGGHKNTSPAVAGASHRSSVPVGAIVGASIGGLVLITAALFVLLRWYRRRAMVPPEYDYGSVAQQDTPPHVTPFVDPSQSVAMTQAGDRGLMFVPGLPSSTASPSLSRPQSPAVLPSQKALAMAAARQGSMDVQSPGAGSSVTGVPGDRKDPAAFQQIASRPHTPGPGASSEAGSSSGGPSIAGVLYSNPSANDLRHVLAAEDDELPPAYTPS
ncbi:hypothetical protein C8Q70DRAFT_1045043 [Cubamyces menziesii]|nr:hypothetical protein C8Q70DRAFT_1045043 [Cubamyces menziesii]